MESKKFELTAPVAIVCAGIIIAGAILYTNYTGSPTAVGGEQEQSVNVPAPSAAEHIVGSPDAPVVLVEYTDFECPYCSMVHPTLKQLVAESNGQVAWVLRNLPLDSIHPNARPAALGAECVAQLLGNNAYWQFSDVLFANQQNLSATFVRQSALALGVQAAAYDSCIADPGTTAVVDTHVQEATSAGARGTPFTVVYGGGQQTPISGALPYAQFKAVIDSALSRQ